MNKNNEKNKIWFTSDIHFAHNNVLKYDNRPFKDIHHMADVIIERHNSVVGVDDDWYFLGDFCFNRKLTRGYLERMNGNKFFIKGNHDKQRDIDILSEYGTYLGQQIDLIIDKHHIVLNHYAMRVWNRNHHGSILLYGHSHLGLERESWGKSMDVGIMGNDYYPYEFYKDIMPIMNKREIKIIDHHCKNN